MTKQKVDLPSRGVSLYVRTCGSGHPILLMHGGLGLDHTTLLPITKCRDSFMLILYDHRCNGRSTGADLCSLTWENLTEDAEALRERLGIGQWAVLGHAFGGMIALEYALRFPKSLTHLILMDTGADAALVQRNAPRVLAAKGFSSRKVEIARRLFNGELLPKEVPGAILAIGKAYYYKPNFITQVRALANALRVHSKPEVSVYAYRNLLRDWCIMDRLPEITAPALIIAAEDDFQFPPEHQREMAKALPNARYHLIRKASHNPLVERPTETLALIRDFMK
jgi:proline iminopeptidase